MDPVTGANNKCERDLCHPKRSQLMSMDFNEYNLLKMVTGIHYHHQKLSGYCPFHFLKWEQTEQNIKYLF